MPAPSALDPWLAARRFGIVIDAGSSGSRLQIYSWRDPRVVTYEQGQKVFDTLPKVEKGTKVGDEWLSKVEPGISTFADNPQDIHLYLGPLLAHAEKHIPPSLHVETPLFLLATAGMRLLPQEKQSAILSAACNFFRFHSNFKLDDSPTCRYSIRVITGQEEGLFGWIAVNYLMDGFRHGHDSATYGFLDMGGASTQIAFEPGKTERGRHPENLVDVRLRLLGGNEINHQVFVTTWLGYGTNQARERYVGHAISDFETHRSSEDERELVPDPCLPVGLTLTETPVHTGPSTAHTRKPHMLLGTGSFEQCLKRTAPLLNKSAPCSDEPCLFNGVHVPSIDFSVSHFIGVSEYWYSSEHVFGLGGPYDVVQYERAASEFCARPWQEVVEEHETTRTVGHLGGDGEVESGGKVVSTGKWGKEVEISRLEMQCFKAAWIVNVLHEGIGLPRIVDPGGNRTSHSSVDKLDEKVDQKGLGRPTFQSVDAIGDTAISWTLGKMVLEASKEVPAASAATPPLRDPLDTPASDSSSTLSSRPPLIDFDKFEDRISHRLPSSLTRHSLGVSPFAILFYFSLMSVFVGLTFRLRHRLRTAIRRLRRGSFKREKPEVVFDAYTVEEGKLGSRPPTPFASAPPSPTGPAPPTPRVLASVSLALRRILFSVRTPKTASARTSPGRFSPPRATVPVFPNSTASAFYTTASRSGASTPTNVADEPHPLSSFAQSRSRNSSQMNLTTRTVPYSRSTSAQQLFAPHEP